jgi:hypothetical protein
VERHAAKKVNLAKTAYVHLTKLANQPTHAVQVQTKNVAKITKPAKTAHAHQTPVRLLINAVLSVVINRKLAKLIQLLKFNHVSQKNPIVVQAKLNLNAQANKVQLDMLAVYMAVELVETNV